MVGRIAKSPRHSKKSLKGSRRRTATIECLESRLMLSATQLLPTGDATEAVPPFVAFNGSVYFLTGDSLTDTMLWKTNGTLAGTTLVKNLGVKDSPGQLVASGSEMYFEIANSNNASQLWQSDGTAANTTAVSTGHNPNQLTLDNSGNLFFTTTTSSGNYTNQMWEYAVGGSPTNVVTASYANEGPEDLINANGSIFFVEAISPGPFQLFRYNGTANSITQITTGTYLDSIGQFPFAEAAIGNFLYFGADDYSDGFNAHEYVVKSDGTGLTNLTPNGDNVSSSVTPVAVGSEVYFAASDSTGNTQIWKTDGTAANTSRVTDIDDPSGSNPDGTSGLNPTDMLAVGSNLFFSGDFGSTAGNEIGVLNASNPSGALLKDIFTGSTSGSPNSSYPSLFTAVGSDLYFTAAISDTEATLWVSDGTAGGTTQAAVIDSSDPVGPLGLTGLGSTLYFASVTGSTGTDSNGNLVYLPFSFSSGLSTPTVDVTDGSGTYTGTAFSATAQVAGTNGVFGDSLEGVTPTLTYYAGATATGTPLSGAPTTVGTYTVLADFAGSADYTSASNSTTFTINAATPSVDVTDASNMYTGTTFTATATVEGVESGATFGPSLEGVSPTLTYYAGSTATGTPLSGAPITVGTYTVLANFAGSTDYTSASDTTTFTISAATPTVDVTDAGGVYDGTSFPATATVEGVESGAMFGPSLESVSPTLTYYAGPTATGTPLSGAPTTVGTYTVVANFAGSADYTSATNSTTFMITVATPTVDVTDAGGVYNGTSFPATATVEGVESGATFGPSLESVSPTLTYYAGPTATGTPLSGAPTTVGIYTVVASFAGSADYTSASNSTTFTISVATPMVDVTDAGGIYNGTAFPATATVEGVESGAMFGPSLESVSPTLTYYAGPTATGTPLSGAPIVVGTYTVVANFAGSTDYTSASNSTTFMITPATPSVDVTEAGGIYNGTSFPATATVEGVESGATFGPSLENVSPTLTYYAGPTATGTALSGAPTTVGTYTVVASFAGSPDYTSATNSTTFMITAATPSVDITDVGGVYNGTAYSATATVEGVGSGASFGPSLESVSPTFTYYAGATATGTALSGAPENVGTYTAVAAFHGSADYTTASTTTTFSITPAKASFNVTDSGGVYNGHAFTASGNATGVGGANIGTPKFTYYLASDTTFSNPLKIVPINAGSYVVVASFDKNSNYLPASTKISVSITKATPTIDATDASGVYAAHPFFASGHVIGVGGATLLAPVYTYYLASDTTFSNPLKYAPTNVGNYVVVASYAGDNNYTSASKTISFSITKAAPTLHVTAPGGTYNGQPFSATGYVASLRGGDIGTLTFTYYLASDTTFQHVLSGAPTNPGSYVVIATFAGSSNYSSTSKKVSFSIKS